MALEQITKLIIEFQPTNLTNSIKRFQKIKYEINISLNHVTFFCQIVTFKKYVIAYLFTLG